MSYILVLVAAWFTAVVGRAVPPCPSEAAIEVKCLNDSGISKAEVNSWKDIQNPMTAEALKTTCQWASKAMPVYKCLLNELQRCPLHIKNFTDLPVDDLSNITDTICKDPNIKFHCIVEAHQKNSYIDSCAEAQASSFDPSRQTEQQVGCERQKIRTRCAVDVISKCDLHTGTAVASVSIKFQAVCESGR